MIRKALVLFVLCGYVMPSTAYQAVNGQPPTEFLNNSATPAATNAVLIFLDDTEKEEIYSITSGFLAAFTQEAAPIIVSTSLINNIRSTVQPSEKDPLKLFATAKELYQKETPTAQEKAIIKGIIASTIQFDEQAANKWIIKKINDYLYLLLPNDYLLSKNITPDKVQQFSSANTVTDTEKALGLKVNHLTTVETKSIADPINSPEVADYFIDALNDIFVTTKEYPNQAMIPNMSVFIHGHGFLRTEICDLSLNQFKIFLSFLEKIQTKLLIYKSCYAASTNTSLIYQDATAGAQATYSFPIITIALTDTPTRTNSIALMLKQGVMQPYIATDYSCFVAAITASDMIEYSKAIRCIEPTLLESNIPQIRYPGLPWFSILDYDIVASIGGIMAKTRTQPLNIATFFAKQGKRAAPYATLLYAHDIPFELIIDTKMPTTAANDPSLATTGNCYVPIFVSMIPGRAVHTLKKISSSCNTALDIMANFYLEELYYPKLFSIDELTAPFSAQMSKALSTDAPSGTLTNVMVSIAKGTCTTYFTYQGTVYIAFGCAQEDDEDFGPEQLPAVANEKQRAAYESLLKKYGKHGTLKQLEPEHTYLTTETAAAIQQAQEKKIATLKQQAASTRKPLQKKCTVYKRQSKKRALAKARFCQRTRTYR